MTVFSPAISYPPIRTHDRRNSSDIVFGVWVSIAVIGLAIVAAALGAALVIDPVVPILS
jgi:hypothetical protein